MGRKYENLSEKQKSKISVSLKDHYKNNERSEETKKKLSKSLTEFHKQNTKYTEDYWWEQCKYKWGDRFDYSKVKYEWWTKKIEIICKKHGSFFKSPSEFIQSKHGCPVCGSVEGNKAVPIEKKREQAKRLNDSLTPEDRKKNGEKVSKTMIETGRSIPRELKSDWELYKFDVYKLSKQQPVHLLENYEKRGRNRENYELDHIYSIYDGFVNKIDPVIISHIENLRYIPKRENVQKGLKSDITIDGLLEKINDDVS